MLICVSLYISIWTLLYLGDLEVIFFLYEPGVL